MKRAVLLLAAAALLVLGAWWWLRSPEPAPEEHATAEPAIEPSAPPAPVVPGVAPASISGRVVRAGAGVPGARVTLRIAAIRTAETIADGRFTFDGVPAGEEAWLSASLGDEASPLQGPVLLAPGEQRAGLSLELLAGAAVAGRVVDSQTRAPIAGAVLVTSGGGGTTDHDGRFTLHGLAAGHTWLEASARGHLPRVEWLSLESARAHSGLELSLDPSASLSGTVRQQGAGIAGATVWAEQQIGSRVGSTQGPVSSAAGGAWKLEVSPGLLHVIGQLPDGTRIQGPHVRVEAGEARTGIDLEAGEALGVDGQARLDGAPLEGAVLTLFDSRSSEAAAFTSTGPAGRFHFERVAVGRYLIQVRKGALSAQTGPFEQTGEGLPWTVDVSAGAVLEGHVEPAAAGVQVRWRSGDWAGDAARTLTDPQGAFRFEGVAAGVLLVEAEGEQGSAAARATAGVQGLVLHLARGRLKVFVEDERGGPVSDFALTLVPRSGGLVRRFPVLSPTGTFSLELPAGEWRVEATAAGYADADAQMVEVREVEAEVRLRLLGAVQVRGVVRDAASRLPIRGASVSVIRMGGPKGLQFRLMGRTSGGETDGNGEFFIPAAALPATVEVRHPLFRTIYERVPEVRDGAARMELVMQPGASPPPGERIMEYEGVGMQLQGDREKIWVIQVYERSPAEAAGLQAGDVIVLIDGGPVVLPVERAVQQILGPSGTVVKLTIRRGNELLEFSVRRRSIAL